MPYKQTTTVLLFLVTLYILWYWQAWFSRPFNSPYTCNDILLVDVILLFSLSNVLVECYWLLKLQLFCIFLCWQYQISYSTVSIQLQRTLLCQCPFSTTCLLPFNVIKKLFTFFKITRSECLRKLHNCLPYKCYWCPCPLLTSGHGLARAKGKWVC